jgi:hypothetical protein
VVELVRRYGELPDEDVLGAIIRAAFAWDPYLRELGGVDLDDRNFMALARAGKLVTSSAEDLREPD